MGRKVTSFLAGLLALLGCAPVFGLAVEHPPGYPVSQHPDWPAGLADLLNRGGRVYGYAPFVGEFFFYAGDTEEFNEFIEQYAALKGTPMKLLLHPGQGKTRTLGNYAGGEDRTIPFDWELKVLYRGWHSEAPPDPTTTKPGYVVTVEAWLGGDLELEKLNVPLSLKVKSGEKNEEFVKFITSHNTKREQRRDSKESTQPGGRDTHSEGHSAASSSWRMLWAALALCWAGIPARLPSRSRTLRADSRGKGRG